MKLEIQNSKLEKRGEGVVPSWELLVHTPAVFVRVANTGLAGYGTWKSIRKMEGKQEKAGKPMTEKAFSLKETPPVFFVSVASKGVTNAVSLLFATLARECVSVAGEEFRGWNWGRRDRQGADSRGLAGERIVLGLKGLRKTARSKRARILTDDHTEA